MIKCKIVEFEEIEVSASGDIITLLSEVTVLLQSLYNGIDDKRLKARFKSSIERAAADDCLFNEAKMEKIAREKCKDSKDPFIKFLAEILSGRGGSNE